MKYIVKKSTLGGGVKIPGSKSHTIRALAFALLADGESEIESPLVSSDTISGLGMIKSLGAEVRDTGNSWIVKGTGGLIAPPADVVDVGNSGTSLYIGLGIASLSEGYTVFTGDSQIRSRPAAGLIRSLSDLGADVISTRGNGKPPVIVRGRLKGGETSIEAVTSQYLTSLLIAAPLAKGVSRIKVPLLNEKPYVEMTLDWLSRLGIDVDNRDFKEFIVHPDQKYSTFSVEIPADFSSATFFLAAAAVTGCELTLTGLDFNDTQGDKEVVNILKRMGASVDINGRTMTIKGGQLRGGEFDLNAIPDALPALSAVACYAEGETRFVNVAQARLKETDRIKVMHDELLRMGADIEELPDGLLIRGCKLRGAAVSGHSDHRVVMALSVAALGAEWETVIDTAEAVSVTFPEFMTLMTGCGADIGRMED